MNDVSENKGELVFIIILLSKLYLSQENVYKLKNKRK